MMLTGKARIAGVMGWPVAHSRSPLLHGTWLARHEIDGAYVPFAVHPDQLAAALQGLRALGLQGANLTIPHKEAALGHMDRLDEAARAIGAVNTVIAGEDGTLEGRNTDAFGFVESLRALAPQTLAAGGRAVILGASGAAWAVAYGLAREGFGEICLLNRTRTRAETVAADLGGFGAAMTVGDWAGAEDALRGAGLLVNTTSLGMTGEPPLDLVIDRLPKTAAVADIVYAPLETALLAQARARGHPVVPGLWMLLHQARPGFEAWFGVAPEADEALYAAIAAGL